MPRHAKAQKLICYLLTTSNLLLLGLSAAFDTVDRTSLVSRLATRFGIRDSSWFRLYLQLRKQFVSVNGIDSSLGNLQYGVSQGSVLSPLLHSLYRSPLADIIIAKKNIIPFHL